MSTAVNWHVAAHRPAAPAATLALLPETCKGATTVAIRVWPRMFTNKKFYAAFDSLLAALKGGGASVVLIARDTDRAAVDGWVSGLKFPAGRCKVCFVPDIDFANFQSWPRDVLLFATTDGKVVAVKTKHGSMISRRPGTLDQWMITTFGLTAIDRGNILLDGGDSLVVDRDHWLLGAGAVAKMIAPKTDQTSWDNALELIARNVANPTLIGSHSSALSLTIRLALSRVKARYRWVDAKERAFDEASLTEKAMIHVAAALDFLRNAFNSGGTKMEWAHADMVVAVTGKPRNGLPCVLVADPTHPLCPTSASATAMGQILDQVEKDLRQKGLDVYRNPAPYYGTGILPYNNSIVQTDPDVVWLPVFAADIPAMKAIDDENYRIWRDVLKFGTVIRVPGFYPLAKLGGCIRCATLPLPNMP